NGALEQLIADSLRKQQMYSLDDPAPRQAVHEGCKEIRQQLPILQRLLERAELCREQGLPALGKKLARRGSVRAVAVNGRDGLRTAGRHSNSLAVLGQQIAAEHQRIET